MFSFAKLACFYVLLDFGVLLEKPQNLNEGKYTGKAARPGQFPFAIRLYSKTKNSKVTYCSATIITAIKLLTAGHCCHAKAFRIAVLGDPDQTDFVSATNKSKYVVRHVKKVILHPAFERTAAKLVHDLCLLILGKPLDLRNGHDVIPVSYQKMKNKKNCTALGWGSNFGYEVQHRLYYKEAVGYRCNLVFNNSSKYWFICLEPHSVCPGDSGGPLVCDGKLYGIASFFIGHGDHSNPRCEEGVVDYYSEVAAERDFIEQNGSHDDPKSPCSWVISISFLAFSLMINHKIV